MKRFSPIKAKEARLALGLTQRQVADQLAFTVTAVSCWEGGTRTPNLGTFCTLAAILRVEPGELLEEA